MYGIMRANSPLVLLQGYAVAWCEQENLLGMVLLKYFAKKYKKEWLAEVDTVRGMCCDGEPVSNILHYRWHSKGEKYCTFYNFYIPSLSLLFLELSASYLHIHFNKTSLSAK